MDCPVEVSCFEFWEFVVPYSNPVALKTKNIFAVFYSIYGISIKFWTFSRKEDPHSSRIFQINDRLRLDHPTDNSAASQNILRQSTCLTVPNTSKIFMRALLPYVFTIVLTNNLENVSLIEVWNHRVVC